MLATHDHHVVLDACVLIPPVLCDILLRCAETPALYRPRWTVQILDEVSRNQERAARLTPDRVASWRRVVGAVFPEALIEGYQHFEAECLNHADDRHVLAAAIRIEADTIVTFNTRHFQPEALQPWGVAARTPDEYLNVLYDHAPLIFTSKLSQMAEKRSLNLAELTARLANHCPTLGSRIRLDQSFDS